MLKILLLALPLIVGCTSTPHTYRTSVGAGTPLEMVVKGSRPRVEVHNDGPDALSVVMTPPRGIAFQSTLTPGMMTMRTLPGPVRLRFAAQGPRGCAFKVTAHGSNGLTADLALRGVEE